MESESSHRAFSDVVPLRDILGLLFIVTLGMLFDPRFVLAQLGQISLLVALIIIGKALIIGATKRVFGYGNMAPWIVRLAFARSASSLLCWRERG